jgi:hypothetical protein
MVSKLRLLSTWREWYDGVMNKKRFIVKVDYTIDPPQYQIIDTLDQSVIIRYADENKAESICEEFNEKVEQ